MQRYNIYCELPPTNTKSCRTIYGISVMGSVNDGTIQLKELVEELFNFFGIENTKGCYRIYNDIKMRKSDSRTYYLDSMRAELNHKMREEDKRFR